MNRPRDNRFKNPTLVVLPLFVILVFTVWLFAPWMRRVDLHDPWLSRACLLNAAIWLIVLWWSLHHLTFKIAALVTGRSSGTRDDPQVQRATSPPTPRFAILCPTCDDFQWQACLSCLTQNYPTELLQVVICDDSTGDEYRKSIDEFQQQFPHVIVLRRENRRGFKAGNLNHALRSPNVTAEWIVIVDADQNVPQNYLSQFAMAVADLPGNVAYVQGRQESDHVLLAESTRFQRDLGVEIDMFYSYDLALRTEYGFAPFIGHGAVLRRAAWQKVPFPEVVSEDFALSMELRNQGFMGVHNAEVHAWESFPPSFSAFLIRFRKFAGGTSELYKRHLYRFLLGPATFTEKLDLWMMIGWYALMPFVIFNGYLSTYVGHRLWELRVSALHPVLPYVFVLMFLASFPVLCSASPTFLHALKHWLWSSAIYGACLPLASIRFLTHFLFPKAPTFDRTPKDSHTPPLGWVTCLGMVVLGLATVGLGWHWYSPFSPVMAGLGVSYLSVPLYTKLNESSPLGLIARLVVLIPGLLYTYALWEMWRWQSM